RRIVEPRYDVGHRRLARAAPPNERHDRTAGHRDAEIPHDGRPRAILEVDALEAYLAYEARRLARVRPIRLVGVHLQHVEHSLGGRERPLQLREGIYNVPNGLEAQER